jgi:hypothetical protein
MGSAVGVRALPCVDGRLRAQGGVARVAARAEYGFSRVRLLLSRDMTEA